MAEIFSYAIKVLTSAGTSSTEIIQNSIFFWVGTLLLKGTLKTACAQKQVTKHDIWIIGPKYGVCCTRYQSFRKFGAGHSKRESSKNWILRCFPKPNTISLRDYELILCMLEFLHLIKKWNSQANSQRPSCNHTKCTLGISLRISCSN